MAVFVGAGTVGTFNVGFSLRVSSRAWSMSSVNLGVSSNFVRGSDPVVKELNFTYFIFSLGLAAVCDFLKLVSIGILQIVHATFAKFSND